MDKPSISGKNIFSIQDKDKEITYQYRKTSSAFFKYPKTRMEVAIETGIGVQNICWYVGKLRKIDQIKVIRKGTCPITKHSGVEFLCTNPKRWPIQHGMQQKLNL